MEPYADDDAKRRKRNFFGFNPESNIQGWILVSKEGLPISSAFAREVNEEIVSAAIAAIQGVSERVVKELARGDLKRILIEGVEGIIILSKVGSKVILGRLVKSDANSGMVSFDIQGLSYKIAQLLDDPDKTDDKKGE